MPTAHIVSRSARFEWNDELALDLASELTPLANEMPPAERIAALAYQIAVAAAELDHMADHDDSVRAELMGLLVTELTAAGFRGLRKLQAEHGRARHLRLVTG